MTKKIFQTPDLRIPYTIEHFEELDSTNTRLRSYAEKGTGEGLVIVAGFQTKGRGKQGNVWISPPGENLTFSVLIRPSVYAHKAPLITQIVCRSVAEVLRSKYNIPVSFKRPNDLLSDGKKICGVLVETSGNPSAPLEWVIIGIGLNVNSPADGLLPGAVSLSAITGLKYSLPEILEALLCRLDHDIRPLYAGRP